MSNLSPIKVMKRVATCSIQRSAMPSIAVASAENDGVCKLERPTLNVPPIKRQVSFGKIQIREYAPTIGDQPFVSAGVPIALSNTKVREFNDVPIDIYEHVRRPLRRQNSRQLMLKPNVRAAMLLSEGFKKEEINDAALAAHEAKASIHHSAQRKSWDQINEKLENTTRLLTTLSRRPMLRRSSSSSR